MQTFEEVLKASPEELLKQIHPIVSSREGTSVTRKSRVVAKKLGLTHTQLICAVGFNHHIRELPDIAHLLGFENYDELARARNTCFVTDIYDRLGIKDVLAIYQHVLKDSKHLQIMQYLLSARLQRIEDRIEATVNSLIIERYKKEMRAIYNDGVAQLDFAEDRLRKTNSGFRALLNEVVMIVESKLFPAGDVFFRDTILPEEKRRLIIKGLIPRELIEARLREPHISTQERKVLEEQLRLFT